MTLARPFTLLALLVLLCLGAPPVTASGRAELDSLVASERAFAALSVEKGMREAFLTYLAADGVLLRPRAVNGRQVWEARGPVPATLLWEPSAAEVSAAGDLGWTTGPSELRPYDATQPVGYGHFVSIWQKQADGSWRVALDVGISHDRPGRGVGSHAFVVGPEHRRAYAKDLDLEALDRDWTSDARTLGAEVAFTRWTTSDVRLYREGAEPVGGARAARDSYSAIPGAAAWHPDSQRVARSGDLGCTYGVVERVQPGDARPDSSAYLHIWRRVGPARWRAALVLEKPLPRTAKP